MIKMFLLDISCYLSEESADTGEEVFDVQATYKVPCKIVVKCLIKLSPT
jgi:hypothetical protein